MKANLFIHASVVNHIEGSRTSQTFVVENIETDDFHMNKNASLEAMNELLHSLSSEEKEFYYLGHEVVRLPLVVVEEKAFSDLLFQKMSNKSI